jgi:hypothetical protein
MLPKSSNQRLLVLTWPSSYPDEIRVWGLVLIRHIATEPQSTSEVLLLIIFVAHRSVFLSVCYNSPLFRNGAAPDALEIQKSKV